jgi:hypothetical protein
MFRLQHMIGWLLVLGWRWRTDGPSQPCSTVLTEKTVLITAIFAICIDATKETGANPCCSCGVRHVLTQSSAHLSAYASAELGCARCHGLLLDLLGVQRQRARTQASSILLTAELCDLYAENWLKASSSSKGENKIDFPWPRTYELKRSG